jgi:hypothetical protein
MLSGDGAPFENRLSHISYSYQTSTVRALAILYVTAPRGSSHQGQAGHFVTTEQLFNIVGMESHSVSEAEHAWGEGPPAPQHNPRDWVQTRWAVHPPSFPCHAVGRRLAHPSASGHDLRNGLRPAQPAL